MRIEICGGIASGKTTLARQVQQLGVAGVFEDFSSIAFLSDFYETPEIYTYETEIAFLLQHLYQIKKSSLENKCIICDYSIEQDYAYAMNNLQIDEMESFKQIYSIARSKMVDTSLIICLQCSPEVLKRRITKRNRMNEHNISIDYLTLTCAQIENRIKQITTPVIYFDTEKINFLDIDVVNRNVMPIINSFIKD